MIHRLLALSLVACSATASDAPERVQLVPVEAAPAPEPGNTALLSRYRLGKAVSYANVVLWPVVDTGAPTLPAGAVSLANALTAGTVTITEIGQGGTVPQLQIENRGDKAVLAAAGDVVVGGKQDRILVESLILPPKSGPQVVAVNCVERGRWSPANAALQFSYGGKAEVDLKRTVQMEKSQGRTWEKVAEVNLEKKVDAASGTYMASLRSDTRVDPYLQALTPGLGADAVGYVAAVGGTLRAVELYGSPALFGQVREASLRSLAMEAATDPARGGAPAAESAQAFLADAISAPVIGRKQGGSAEQVETDGERTKSYQLRAADGAILQMNAYAE